MLYLFLSPFFASHAAVDLTVRINENAFPVGFKQDSTWQGMDVDVLNILTAKSGLTYKIITMPFSRSISELSKGEIDMVVNLTKNDERSMVMNWLGPIRQTKTALLVSNKNQGATITNIDELLNILQAKKMHLGKIIGVSYSPYLDQQLQNNVQLFSQTWNSATRGQILEMLQKDRIFGFFQDEFEAKSLINAHKGDPTKLYSGLSIRPTTIDESTEGAYIGVSKYLSSDTMSKLSLAFQQIQNDGTLDKIYKKWAGISEN